MLVEIPYDKSVLAVDVPEDAKVYRSSYPEPAAPASSIVSDALRNPIGSPGLRQLLAARREGKVVIVVSDITRPVPYREFLPELAGEIESTGVRPEEILILVATGMHRPSTPDEREYMFGDAAKKYAIVDHDSTGKLKRIEGLSFSGRPVFLNRDFVEAGFRIVTGLVEPHFMAGFSGGRKAVCPGLVSLDTIQAFHSHDFLASPGAANAILEGNPCHEEALSIARLAGVDYSLNVVLDSGKRLVAAFAGGLEAAHEKACSFVRRHACPVVENESDAVITGSGGYPLDTTFYQCVKGMVGAIPAVKPGGKIISAGFCREHLGSQEYRDIMFAHSQDCHGFIEHIKKSCRVEKDQWEFQMQIRAVDKVGTGGLIFLSSGLDEDEAEHISALSINKEPHLVKRALQDMVDTLVSENKTIAVIPEGPYCTPLSGGGK
ncbi:MAG TPA: nickel-dependent lactate racemase [Desulfomonilia bacterium]